MIFLGTYTQSTVIGIIGVLVVSSIRISYKGCISKMLYNNFIGILLYHIPAQSQNLPKHANQLIKAF